MAGTSRGQTSHLEQALLTKGPGFSFFQAFRLLKALAGQHEGEKATIRVRPDLSLGFPSTDIVKIERLNHDQPQYDLTVSFLGLYGTSSPLPTFYTEDLIDEQSQDESVNRDFFDFINQRVYELLYLAWSKYRQHLRVVEENHFQSLERLFCLVGLGEKELRDEFRSPNLMIRYAGLFTQFPRSAAGLQALLRDALGLKSLSIEECLATWVPIPVEQRARLGTQSSSLGRNIYVGQMIQDRMGAFRIHIGPLKKRQFQELMPGMPKHELLTTMVRLYIPEALEYDLHVSMYPGEAQKTCLGGAQWSVLGLDTWVFSRSSIGEVEVTFQPENLN
jgi:type VI secretion system protein ImpH